MTLPWEKLTNARNSVLVHNTKVDSLQQFVSNRQKKESMKFESTTLAGQKEATGHEEREMNFLSVFHCCSNVFFLFVFVFFCFVFVFIFIFFLFFFLLVLSSWVCVWCSSPQNGSPYFFCFNIFLAGVQLSVFTSSLILANPLKLSCSLPSTWCRREEHPFPLVLNLRRKFGTPVFFLSSSTNAVIHPCPTDPQPAL